MKFTFLYKIVTFVIRKCQAWLGIPTLGARAIVLNSKNQVLLVKHTYQPHWYLPGGGIKKGESAKIGMQRELKEEVGLVSADEPQLFGIYYNTYLGTHDYAIIYIVKNPSFIEANSPEIEQFDWFDYENLPQMISPGTLRRLNEYFKNSPPSDIW